MGRLNRNACHQKRVAFVAADRDRCGHNEGVHDGESPFWVGFSKRLDTLCVDKLRYSNTREGVHVSLAI